MQRNIAETVLGAVVLVVAAGFLFFFQRTTNIEPASGYELTASFSKVDGLETGAPVRVGGVTVGKVTALDLDKQNFKALVRMNIDNDLKLPTDTAAVVASAGMLDGKFMSLEPGSEEDTLEPGARIEYTQSTPSLEQLLGQVIFSLTNKDEKSSAKSAAPNRTAPVPAMTATPEDEAE